MMRKVILTAVAAAAIAVGAQAQTVYYAQAGDPLAISNLTEAGTSGGGDVTYQWYRNDMEIAGATQKNYIVPADLANGTNVRFRRRAVALDCAIGNVAYADITVTFCNVAINGVCWADVHVDTFRTFAAQADMYTKFYQFNRTKPWPAAGGITGTWTTVSEDIPNGWHADSSPCPKGWRLPTRDEYAMLLDNSTPANGVWADVSYGKGNSVNGRFFGIRAASCTLLPYDMRGCVFFPASGCRQPWDGGHDEQIYRGFSWSNTQNNGSFGGHFMDFAGTYASIGSDTKSYGFPVRCVRGGN